MTTIDRSRLNKSSGSVFIIFGFSIIHQAQDDPRDLAQEFDLSPYISFSSVQVAFLIERPSGSQLSN